MAPLPPNSTPRYKVEYTVNGESHDYQLRTAASPAAVGTFIGALLAALAPELYQTTIGTVSFAADNSNIFLPVVTGAEGLIAGTGSGAYEQKAWYIDFIGRSSLGRRWRLAMFGIRTLAGDFRYAAGENASVTATIAVLNAFTPSLVAIDGGTVTVYPYANAGVNAYWQRALRP